MSHASVSDDFETPLLVSKDFTITVEISKVSVPILQVESVPSVPVLFLMFLDLCGKRVNAFVKLHDAFFQSCQFLFSPLDHIPLRRSTDAGWSFHSLLQDGEPILHVHGNAKGYTVA